MSCIIQWNWISKPSEKQVGFLSMKKNGRPLQRMKDSAETVPLLAPTSHTLKGIMVFIIVQTTKNCSNIISIGLILIVSSMPSWGYTLVTILRQNCWSLLQIYYSRGTNHRSDPQVLQISSPARTWLPLLHRAAARSANPWRRSTVFSRSFG